MMRCLSKRSTSAVPPVPFGDRSSMLVLLLTAVVTALVAACSTTSRGTRGATPTAIVGSRPMASGVNLASLPTITLTAYDDSFVMPGTMPAGLTEIQFVNAGKQPHQAAFGRVKPGVTVEQVLAAAKRGASALPYLFSALDFAAAQTPLSRALNKRRSLT